MSERQALPARPNLDHLKKQAKKRLLELRAKDRTVKLAEAQLAIARNYGFASWRKLKAEVEAKAPPKDATAFFDAIRKDDVAEVQKLLKRDAALVSATTDAGETPLHLAAETNNAQIIELLIKHGCDPKKRYGQSAHTALSWAIVVNSFDAARAPIKAGERPDLFCAAGLGELEIVKAFFDTEGKLKPGASETGSSRFATDGSRLKRPSDDSRDVVSDALYMAARNGQANVVKYLLDEQNPDVNFRAYMSATPLHWAYYGGSRAVIDLLSAAGADRTIRDGVMDCPPRAFGICVTANWGIADLVTRALKINRRLVQINDGRGTPLHEAARGGQLKALVVLLSAGADAAALDREGKTALDRALEGNHAEVARVLEEYARKFKQIAAKYQPTAWQPIMDASFRGDAKRVVALLDAGADPNVLSKTNFKHRPLHRAIEHKKTSPKTAGHEQVVRVLLERGADASMRATMSNVTALQLAAMDEPRFVPIIRKHFDPADIFHAAVVGDAKLVRALLKKDKSLAMKEDLNGWQPLHYCAASAMYRHSDESSKDLVTIAELLIAAGADPMATHLWENTWPIPVLYHCCGQQDNPAVAEALFKAGATPYDNETVYHASDEDHRACLALIEKYADRKKLADEATKCLRTQLRWGRTRGVKWLLEHGADPNAVGEQHGQSALQEAVAQSKADAVLTLLLRFGADPKKKNGAGKSAIDLARLSKKSRIISLLTRR